MFQFALTVHKNFLECIGKIETFSNNISFIYRPRNTTDFCRTSNSGPITVEDVFKTLPFDNEVVLIDITGKELFQVLSRSVKGKREDEDGGFLHVSGIRFMIRGHSVENVCVEGNLTPLDLGKVYRVAVNDFMASGGDGYEIFARKPAQYTGLSLREVFVDFIRKRRIVNPRVERRIVRK